MTFWPFQHVACYNEPYTRAFVAPRCSSAYCLFILSIIALILIPIYVTFASDNVWVKESTVREQPQVQFRHELLVLAAGEAASDSVGWSSTGDLVSLIPGQVLVPDVRSTSIDQNKDGVPDIFNLVVDFPTGNATRQFKKVTFLAVYQVRLSSKVQEVMMGLVSVDLSSPIPASGLWINGELRLRQANALSVVAEVRDVYNDSPLSVKWQSNWAASRQPISLRDLLSRYASRNETISLELLSPPVWEFSPADVFRIEVSMAIPPLLVYFRPQAFELIKFAWMQLLSIAIPTWIVLVWIQGFAFNNQIVETYVVPQLPPKE